MSIQNPSSNHFQDSSHIHIDISTINAEPRHPFLAQERGVDDENGERFGMMFRGLRWEEEKQTSKLDDEVRKTVSMRADVEKQKSNSALEGAIRRAFSMRATPCLVSREAYYCRIDGENGYFDEVGVDEENLLTQPQAHNESYNNKKKRIKIFEICRRLFGFY